MAKILLVEDNELNRDMLSRRLIRKGFEVVIAVDGLKGIEAAQGGGFDLILMDMSLPEVDGWEATRRLKADPRTSPTPIVALTAHAMAGDRERAIEAGCDDYDSKPIEFPRLLSKIEGPAGAEVHAMSLPDDSSAAEASRRRHELRTPVNHILGYAELLIEDAEDLGRPERAEPLRAIHARGKEVLELVSSAAASGDAERGRPGPTPGGAPRNNPCRLRIPARRRFRP